MKKIVLIGLALALLLGYLYYRSFVSGPKYALLQAKEAVQNHNMAAFEKYVNVESLTNSLVDQVTGTPGLAENFIPGLQLGKGMIDLLKPTLARAARTEVKNYVETGRINTRFEGNEMFFSLAAIAGTLVSDDSQFKSIAYVKEKNDVALVGLEFTQPKFDTTVVLEVKMIDQGNYWQATDFTNAGELLQHIIRLQNKQAANR
ncbi:DUF2939 domain-containing protein [Adhaeribacter sp. BT258]|uniref:DUF2939 domain-containing protein n=1 Tax=Adhaeribacter terrigena TaxID=2793070 RepID=A0ABS1C2C8_9BACT|nr:DUF2939 domain-containing protein [Adhaeribacter terrigena]MBK0403558.1 DUF2939 domain-containing protein [Adhaeribacter terrigena]